MFFDSSDTEHTDRHPMIGRADPANRRFDAFDASPNPADSEDNSTTGEETAGPQGEPGFNVDLNAWRRTTLGDSQAERLKRRRVAAPQSNAKSLGIGKRLDNAAGAGLQRLERLQQLTDVRQQVRQQVHQRLEAIKQRARQQIVRSAAKLAGKVGARSAVAAVSGVATGGVAAVVIAGVSILEAALNALRSDTVKKFIIGLLLLFISLLFLLIIIGLSLLQGTRHSGADPRGGTAERPVSADSPIEPALAAGDASFLEGISLSQIDKYLDLYDNLLNQNKLGLTDSQTERARAIIAQLRAKRSELAVVSADRPLMAQKLKEYADLFADLYAVVNGNGEAARQRVLNLTKEHAIRLAGPCQVNYDINIGYKTISPRIWLVLAELGDRAKAQGATLAITCLKTGHRTTTSAGFVSRHVSGKAVDIDTQNSAEALAKTEKLLEFLVQQHRENPQRFGLRELIFNSPTPSYPAGYFNIASGRLVGRSYAGDHQAHSHFHLAVE